MTICTTTGEDELKSSLPYTGDPVNNPFDRVRIYCTDTDNDDILVPQEMIEWFYEESQHDEKHAAVKALTFLMVQVAKMGDEKVGGVYLKNSERIKNMRLVLDNLKADLLKQGVGDVYAGGISRTDINLRRWNPDSPRKRTQYGDALRMDGGSGFGAVGVAGSAYLHEAPCDLPDGVVLIPL
ncbi:hypothetical protein [Enterobacter mori]